MSNYTLNPQWRLIREGSSLIISAGADRQFMIEDLSAEDITALVEFSERKSFKIASFPESIREYADQMVFAGVFRPVLSDAKSMSITLRFIGKKDSSLERAVLENLPERVKSVKSGKPDLTVVVRNGGNLDDLAKEAAKIKTPHVLIDAAYDHTVSVGPLVILGDTACMACLAGRISKNWGDPESPAEPKISGNKPLIAGLIVNALSSLLNEPESLVNKTFTINLEKMSTKQHTLLKYPSCPVCGGAAQNDGQIALPWL